MMFKRKSGFFLAQKAVKVLITGIAIHLKHVFYQRPKRVIARYNSIKQSYMQGPNRLQNIFSRFSKRLKLHVVLFFGRKV